MFKHRHLPISHSIRFITFIIIFQSLKGATVHLCNENNQVNTPQECIIEAESVSKFLQAMRENELPSMIHTLKAGREKGGFPDWMLEYGKNLLNSCDPIAVIFTGSHADTAGAWYLQYVENFRKDITVVPIGLLNESWFLKILMKGNGIIKNRISMSDTITSDTNFSIHFGPILFPLTVKICKKYGFRKDEHVFEWIDREKLLNLRGSYFRENILAIIDIIQMNRWKREIFFTLD